jgi:VIT1/CCC1 family predicted Fe2+/Mn2+ transporter
MACGEYISVSSQRDAEMADVEKEKREQAKGPVAQAHELDELTAIYEDRGISPLLARQVAEELTAKDVIRAHARDELGIDLDDMSNPALAAIASMLAFLVGAGLPLLSAAFIQSHTRRLVSLVVVSTVAMIIFGVSGAVLGGANAFRGGLRVVIGGWIALGITYSIGLAFSRGQVVL